MLLSLREKSKNKKKKGTHTNTNTLITHKKISAYHENVIIKPTGGRHDGSSQYSPGQRPFHRSGQRTLADARLHQPHSDAVDTKILKSKKNSLDDARHDVVGVVVVRMAGSTDGVGKAWDVGDEGLRDVKSDAHTEEENVNGKKMRFERSICMMARRGGAAALESTSPAAKREEKSNLRGSGKNGKYKVTDSCAGVDGLL